MVRLLFFRLFGGIEGGGVGERWEMFWLRVWVCVEAFISRFREELSSTCEVCVIGIISHPSKNSPPLYPSSYILLRINQDQYNTITHPPTDPPNNIRAKAREKARAFGEV